MAEEPKPASGWRSIAGFMQQWQILLPLVVGLFGLVFSLSDRRAKELEVDRQAVVAARAPETIARFRDDPQNTLIEFRATYPPHAFCAALGFFIAENGRLARSALDRPSDQVRDMNDALLVQVEALAEQAGIDAEAFNAFVERAKTSAGPRPEDARCPQVTADPPAYSGWVLEPECLLAIDTFGQNRCNQQRLELQRDVAITAEQKAVTDAPNYPVPARPAPPPGEPTTQTVEPGTSEPAPVDQGPVEPGPVEPEPTEPGSVEPPVEPPVGAAPPPAAGAIAGPGSACDGVSPLIFVQFTDAEDLDSVDKIRDRLLGAGWKIAPAENVPKGRTTGDLRIYAESQHGCADSLAAIVAALPEVKRPINVISLADRYRSLPTNQMELWLPSLD